MVELKLCVKCRLLWIVVFLPIPLTSDIFFFFTFVVVGKHTFGSFLLCEALVSSKYNNVGTIRNNNVYHD